MCVCVCVPLVHFLLNVFVDVVYLGLELLPPLLRWKVTEVFRSRALRKKEEETNKRVNKERSPF